MSGAQKEPGKSRILDLIGEKRIAQWQTSSDSAVLERSRCCRQAVSSESRHCRNVGRIFHCRHQL